MKKIRYKGLSTLEILDEAKNYNKWIADELFPFISSPVLEVGAGTGNLTKHFITNRNFFVTDKDFGLVEKLQEKFHANKNITVEKLDLETRPKKRMRSSFSTVYGVNVLEHIEDDEKALINIHFFLKKGGRVVLLVPAKKFAYTKLDQVLGHFRRYEKKELEDKLNKCGFTVEKIHFFNIVGLISWFVRDKVYKGSINLQPYHVIFFDKIVPLLRIIEKSIPVPVGISLIVVARKR